MDLLKAVQLIEGDIKSTEQQRSARADYCPAGVYSSTKFSTSDIRESLI